VVTRARDQAADLVRALEDRGAEAIVAPVIRIQPIEHLEALRAALAGLSSYRWVVFTSQNAVQIVLDRLVAWGMTPRVFSATSVAAIGSVTADSLRKRGIQPALVPDEFVAEALVAALIGASGGALSGARVLVPNAAEAREVLGEQLRRHGATVENIPVYRTVPVQDDFSDLTSQIGAGRIDAVTFTNPTAVERFASLIGQEQAADLLNTTVVAAIGPVTARAAIELGIKDPLIADTYTVEGLVQKLIDRFAAEQ